MAERELGRDEVKLRVLGKPEANERVLASVFANKLAALVRGLELVDKRVNGAKTLDYLIVDLAPTSASATVIAQRASKQVPTQDSVRIYSDCVAAIAAGRISIAREHPECVAPLRSLARKVGETFSRAELSINGAPTVLIDEAFERQAQRAAQEIRENAEAPKWFIGTVLATFDGKILESDFRGSIPTMHLLLTANEKIDIRCIAPALTLEELRPVLGHRARITGMATYDGTSGLPIRLEITELPQRIKTDADFARWSGAFTPFQPDEWESE